MFAHLGHTIESFEKLNPRWQLFIKDLQNVIEINQETRKTVWSTFNKFKIKTDNSIFQYLEDGDSIEMWSDDYTLMLALGKASKHSSYNLDELRSDHWENLFHRSEKAKQDIYNAIVSASKSNKSCLDCGSWHEVTEIKSKFKFKQNIKVKLISFYQFDELNGMLAIVQSKPPSRLYDRVRQSYLTWLSKKKFPLKNYL